MATVLQQQPAWPDRVRLPLAFGATGLADDLATLAGMEWTAHFVRQHYRGDWSALPLRHKAGATHPIMQIYSDPTATAFVDAPLLARLPHVAAAVGAFECPLGAVRLMRLTPGSEIHPHSDGDLAAEQGWARIHVPITTSAEVEFLLNGTVVAMAPGEAWYLRLSDTHSAANHGDTDRVHLVIDARVNGWLAAQLDSGAA